MQIGCKILHANKLDERRGENERLVYIPMGNRIGDNESENPMMLRKGGLLSLLLVLQLA